MLGISLSIVSVLLSSTAILGPSIFNPISLFSSGTEGVWFDPSDVANLAWRRNLLTWSEDFSVPFVTNTGWSKNGVVASGSRITANAGTSTAFAETVYQNAPAGSALTISAVFSPTVGRNRYVWIGDRGVSPIASATFDLNSVSVVGNAAGVTALVVTLPDLSVKCSITYSRSSIGTSSPQFALAGATYTSDRPSLTWAGGEFLDAKVQLELGSTATEYQRISDVNTEVLERFPTTTMFTDRAGTTAVTTPGQPVGLRLDKSKSLALGSNIVNSALCTVDASTTRPTTTTFSVNNTSGVAANYITNFPAGATSVVVGRTYEITITTTSYSGSPVALQNISQTVNLPVNGTARYLVTPTATSMFIRQNGAGVTSFNATFSVRELAGNHAVAPGDADRLTYGIEPKGGRRNLLTFSEQFENAAWIKPGTSVTANTTAAPDGSITADTLVELAGASTHIIYSNTTGSTATTMSIVAKANTRSAVTIGCNDGSFTNWAAAAFNLSAGTATVAQAAGTLSGTSSIIPLGNGWYRCVLSVVSSGSAVAQVKYGPSNSATPTFGTWADYSYTGDGVSSIYLWGAQLELGSTATNYQKVTTEFDVTEAGVPTRHYVAYSGAHSMSTSSINFTGTDKMSVFAGVRKLSDAVVGVVAELSASLGTNNGSFMLLAPLTGGASGDFVFRSKGTVLSEAASISLAPVSKVVAGLGDISGDIASLRLNGSVASTGTGDQGTGSYGNYPLFLGRRNNATLPFNGRDYGIIIVGKQLTPTEIITTENWLADKTGFFAPVITGVPTIGVS